jgi:hypothetical protein
MIRVSTAYASGFAHQPAASKTTSVARHPEIHPGSRDEAELRSMLQDRTDAERFHHATILELNNESYRRRTAVAAARGQTEGDAA